MSKKILIIGAIPHPDDLRTYGGATTLMQNFVDYCKEHNFQYQHIDTFQYRNRWLNLVSFAFSFLWGILTSKVVMYNVSINGAFTLFYYTAPFAYLFHRKVVFRKFGGFFLQQLNVCPKRKRYRMIYLLNKASVIYFETKALITAAPKVFRYPERIHWFPNCRKPSNIQRKEKFRRRFVYVSLMTEEKGVDHLLNVSDRLPPDYVIHLYGGLMDDKYRNPEYFTGHRAKYYGALKTEQVLKTLAEYDVLILPTYCKTEGYPGILIEAMSLGMPIISTRIGGIPEMVENGYNGFLFTPHDEKALYDAILSINKENYQILSECSARYFKENYDSDKINKKVYRTMVSL